MSVISLPSGLLVARQSFGQKRFDIGFASDLTGAAQTRVLAPPRWMTGLVSIDRMDAANSAIWRVLVVQLRGSVNQLAAHDYFNPAPRGTMRGTLTLNASIAVGATTLVITGGSGQAATTLKKGDWIGVGTDANRQLFQVTADATADGDGIITVTVESPVRYARSSGHTVQWDKPTALYRQAPGSTSTWAANGDMFQGGYSLDLMESWEA